MMVPLGLPMGLPGAAPGRVRVDPVLDEDISEVVEALEALIARHREAPFLSDEEQLGLSDAAMQLLLKLRPQR